MSQVEVNQHMADSLSVQSIPRRYLQLAGRDHTLHVCLAMIGLATQMLGLYVSVLLAPEHGFGAVQE